MKQILLPIIALLLFMDPAGLSLAQTPPLQKVILKVEGVHKKTSFFLMKEVKKMKAALLSVPGVKKVEVRIEKKWFLLYDYGTMRIVVEFERGALTSETLIHAVERISDMKNIYRVKFIE